jgi:hypothetical protein
MENHNENQYTTESPRWEKPVVKAEYSISDITKMGPVGIADGLYS